MRRLILLLLFLSHNLYSQNWAQVGQNIIGEYENDRLGSNVGINTNGTRIIVGIPFFSNNSFVS